MHTVAMIVSTAPIAFAVIGTLSFTTVLLMILGGLVEPTLGYSIR